MKKDNRVCLKMGVVACGVLLGIHSLYAQEKRLITNGGFEQGAKGWWGDAVKDAGPATGRTSQETAYMKVPEGFACQDKIAVAGGRRYRLSMKIRSEGAPEGAVYVQVSYRGKGVPEGWDGPALVDLGTRQEKAVFVTGGTHGWRAFDCVLGTPAAADQFLVYLRKRSGTAGAAYYDDVCLEPTEDAVTTAAELRRGTLAGMWLGDPLPTADSSKVLQAAGAAGARVPPARLILAENGTARIRVHVGEKADVLILNAAHELAVYLGKISGADFLPLSHDGRPAEGSLLVVGRDNVLSRRLCPDIPYEALGPDGFVIRTAGQHIVIAGKTPGGTMYGVNWFLDHKLGVKWLSPDFTHVPQSRTLALPVLNEKQIPRFAFRQVLSYEGQDKLFASRNLLNGNSHGAYGIPSPPEIDHWENGWQRPGLTGSFYDLMPPKQHQKEHPEWFAGGQVAMMNKEVRAHMAEAIVKRLRGVPEYPSVWFGFMDNDWGWDMDPASAAFAKAHGGSPAAPRLDMAIDVADRVRNELPGARIACNAYHWSFPPPADMEVPDYVLVYPMTIHVDYSTPLDRGRNDTLGQGIEGWNRISDNLLVWDHIVNFHGFVQPTPNIYPIGESIRWLATLPHLHGYFAEGSWNTPGAEFSALRVWLIGRMLWDPNIEVKTAVAEYCDAYYGAASPPVKAYIDLMHEEAAKTKAPLWEKTSVDSPLFSLDFIVKADALMAQAEPAVVRNPFLLKHVWQVGLCVDYVALLRRAAFQREAARRGIDWNADTEVRLARFKQAVKACGVTKHSQDATGMAELEAMMALERKPAPPPALANGRSAKDWMEIQDLGINRYYPTTVIVGDARASDGASARMDGASEAWAIQLKMHRVPEEGLWDIYAELRVEAAGADDGETVLRIGHAPPMGRFSPVAFRDVKGGGYCAIKVPGGPFRYDANEGAVSYITGANNTKVRHIYVDRFVLIRATP